MKTKKLVAGLVGVLLTVGLVVGASFAAQGLSRTSRVEAEAGANEESKSAVVPASDAEYFFDFASESINQRLRDHELLAEYQVFDFSAENINQRLRVYDASNKVDAGGFELEHENINQILRDFEASHEIQDTQDGDQADGEREYDLLEKEMRFNLPEGTN